MCRHFSTSACSDKAMFIPLVNIWLKHASPYLSHILLVNFACFIFLNKNLMTDFCSSLKDSDLWPFWIASKQIFLRDWYRLYYIPILRNTEFIIMKKKKNGKNWLFKFLRRSLLIFIIKGFRTIVFISIVISTTFRPICHPAFFRCLSNSGTYTELRTTSFIETTGVTCSDSVSLNRVQVLSIPVVLLACSEDWTATSRYFSLLEA